MTAAEGLKSHGGLVRQTRGPLLCAQAARGAAGFVRRSSPRSSSTRHSSSAATTRAFASSTRCAAPWRRARASARLEAENARQRTQLEAAEVARRVDREGYKQVERSLGDMQSQIARLNQDLSFYRGLVQPDSLVHVKVQQMQIVPERRPGCQPYRLKFVLMQTGKPASVVAGSAAIVDRRSSARQARQLELCRSVAEPPREPGILLSVFRGLRRTRSIAAGVRADAHRTSKSTPAGTRATDFGRRSSGKPRGCRSRLRRAASNVPKGGEDVQTETE